MEGVVGAAVCEVAVIAECVGDPWGVAGVVHDGLTVAGVDAQVELESSTLLHLPTLVPEVVIDVAEGVAGAS